MEKINFFVNLKDSAEVRFDWCRCIPVLRCIFFFGNCIVKIIEKICLNRSLLDK